MPDENIAVKPNKARKGVLIGFLLFTLLIGLWWSVPTYRKARADAMVQELCAKDGGMKVYEAVKLPAERFDKFGEIRVSHSQSRKLDDEFYFTDDTTWLIPESGDIAALVVWRGHYKVIRTRDGKILGAATYYARRGGDPIGPWHVSSFLCPEKTSIKYLAQQVFLK